MSISPENDQFIQQAVSRGIFLNRNQAINEGVRLLRGRQALKDELALARDQLDSGDFEEFDRNGLQDYFDALKQRALSRSDTSSDDV